MAVVEHQHGILSGGSARRDHDLAMAVRTEAAAADIADGRFEALTTGWTGE